jgi:hypothetical protein
MLDSVLRLLHKTLGPPLMNPKQGVGESVATSTTSMQQCTFKVTSQYKHRNRFVMERSRRERVSTYSLDRLLIQSEGGFALQNQVL